MRLFYFLFLVCLLTSCLVEGSKKDVNKKYGISFNEERKKIGFKQVDEKMKLSMNVDIPLYFFNYTDHDVDSLASFGKTLRLDSQTQELAEETDQYYNRHEEKRLYYRHWYKTDSTSITLTYKPEGTDRFEEQQLNFEQADSILKAWNAQPPERSLK